SCRRPCRRVGDDKKSTLLFPPPSSQRTPRGTGWVLSLPRFLPALAPLVAITDFADVFSPGQCARPALPTLDFWVSSPPPVARCDVVCPAVSASRQAFVTLTLRS